MPREKKRGVKKTMIDGKRKRNEIRLDVWKEGEKGTKEG